MLQSRFHPVALIWWRLNCQGASPRCKKNPPNRIVYKPCNLHAQIPQPLRTHLARQDRSYYVCLRIRAPQQVGPSAAAQCCLFTPYSTKLLEWIFTNRFIRSTRSQLDARGCSIIEFTHGLSVWAFVSTVYSSVKAPLVYFPPVQSQWLF